MISIGMMLAMLITSFIKIQINILLVVLKTIFLLGKNNFFTTDKKSS